MTRDDRAELPFALNRRPPRRSRRSYEWSGAKVVIFIVTLAAARTGMSRKSTYALKRGDRAFAAAWLAAPRIRHASRPSKVTKLVKFAIPVSGIQG